MARWPPAPRSQLRDSAGFPPASRHPERYSVVAVEYAPGAGGFVKGSVGTLEAMPQAGPRAVAVISVHASPLSDLGSGENGGMNLAIRRLCEGLSLRGVPTDVFVRRDGPGPDEELIAPLSRLVRLPVGPPTATPKGGHPGAARRVHRCHDPPRALGTARISRHPWPLLARRRRGPAACARRGTSRGCSRFTRWRSPRRAPGCRSMRSVPKPRANSPPRPTGSSRRASSEAKDLIRLYHASRDRICVAQPGVDPRLFADHDGSGLRRRLGLDDGARRPLRRPPRAAEGSADPARRSGAAPQWSGVRATSPW